MKKAHVSAAWLFWLLSGCSSPDAREITVPLLAHSLANCPLPGPANLNLSALGDFPISNRTSEYLSIDAAGTKLTFPADTLALEVDATIDLSEQSFIAFSERRDDRFDFLLWPKGSPCELFRPAETDSYPSKLGGEALGYSSSTGLLLIAGSNDANSAAIVGALSFDARTGRSHVVDPRARAVLSLPRAFATVTDFSGALLVAGGENPIHDSTEPASVLRDSAEIYDQTTQSFEPELVPLADAVTHHAAIALKSGETALFGGRNEVSQATNLVQIVSPQTRTTKLVEPLTFGRNAARVIRLTDDRVLIGGGTDADGHPVAALEWRDVNASALPAPFDGSLALPARFDRAFVALPGGAALALGGCEDRPPETGEDCTVWCAHGCPPTPAPGSLPSYDAFWLGPDGTVEPLDFPLNAPTPVLASGSDGRPWLIAASMDDTGLAIPNSSALYRFDPWQKRFEASDSELGFDASPGEARWVETGLDAFSWLGTDGNGVFLRGVRLGTRSEFSSDLALVALSEDFTRPSHLAPDHVLDSRVSYDPARAVLSFTSADSASTPTCVWIADAKYGDFSATISFSAGLAPALRVGRTPIATDAPCALPTLGSNTTTLELKRTGDRLTVVVAGSRSNCTLMDGSDRVEFGVCQSEFGNTTVTSIQLTRGD